MTDVKGPLFSLGAKGSLKKTLTYQKTVSGHKVYKYTKPGDRSPFVPSASQRDKRMLKNLISVHWQGLTDIQKKLWDDRVKNESFSMSGWNLFYKKAFNSPALYLNLQGYWSMNKDNNGQVDDLSGNGLHAILGGNYPTNSPSFVNSIREKFGLAIDCTGSDKQAVVPDNFRLNPTGNFSILGVVKFTDISGSQAIISKRGTSSGFFIRLDSSKLTFFIYTSAWKSKLADQVIIANKYYDFACVYDKLDSKIYFYLDGDPIGSPVVEGGDIVWSINEFSIGSSRPYSVGADSNAILDDIKFYDRAFSASDIKKISNLTKSPA